MSVPIFTSGVAHARTSPQGVPEDHRDTVLCATAQCLPAPLPPSPAEDEGPKAHLGLVVGLKLDNSEECALVTRESPVSPLQQVWGLEQAGEPRISVSQRDQGMGQER